MRNRVLSIFDLLTLLGEDESLKGCMTELIMIRPFNNPQEAQVVAVGILIQMLLEGSEEKGGNLKPLVQLSVVQAGLEKRVVADTSNLATSNPFFLFGCMIHPVVVEHEAYEADRMGGSDEVVADVISALLCQGLSFHESVAVGNVIRFTENYDAKLVHFQ
jgi:hypothetical protein